MFCVFFTEFALTFILIQSGCDGVGEEERQRSGGKGRIIGEGEGGYG